MVALSFASDAEANIFYKTVTATIASRQKKRRSRKFSPTKTDGSQDTGYDSGVVLRNQNSTGKLFTLSIEHVRTSVRLQNLISCPQSCDAKNSYTVGIFDSQMKHSLNFQSNQNFISNSALKGIHQFSQMPQSTGFEHRRDKKRLNRKLTKADISNPTGFKHLAHVGWNDSKRFELDSDEVNTLDTFLKKAGVSEQQLNDRDTRAYIYDFIQSQNVLDVVKSEKQQQVPPPVPTRNVSHLFIAFFRCALCYDH